MKIGGPKGPSGPTGPAGSKPSTKPQKAVGFDEVLRGDQPAAIKDAQPLLAELAARLRSGEITPAAAAEKLLESVVQKRGATLPTALRQQLDDALRRLVAADPLIANKLRGLESSSGEER